jgi:hypothetical protein
MAEERSSNSRRSEPSAMVCWDAASAPGAFESRIVQKVGKPGQ